MWPSSMPSVKQLAVRANKPRMKIERHLVPSAEAAASDRAKILFTATPISQAELSWPTENVLQPFLVEWADGAGRIALP